MSEGIILDTKLVGEIKGHFFIPDYQRGYRWGEKEVTQLLEDVNANGVKNYCLQPIVVKRLSQEEIQDKQLGEGEWAEVIDGQQRLTSLYLIYQYMHEVISAFPKPAFTLNYETRKDSAAFLQAIDISLKGENIDYWFICKAYETIRDWFSKQTDMTIALFNIRKYFAENVKVIWYEVDQKEDAIALFTRLNIGKIPLTNAELVKALFLSQDSREKMNTERQEEISLQWDNIEKELRSDALWYFLSNQTGQTYQTRINLVLDLIADKPADNRDPYYTFFYFDGRKHDLDQLWLDIQLTFLTLKDWYEDHDLYHKIGYLIASESKTLQELYNASLNTRKDEFHGILHEMIKKSIALKDDNYADLSYEKPADYKNIGRLLLLFNVETVRQIDEQAQRFPFEKYKFGKGGKVKWSLEHIHAQQSEGMKTEKVWKEWLELHLPSIEKGLKDEDLAAEMKMLLEKQPLTGSEFEAIQSKVIQKLSVQGNTEYLHSIGNLALLNTRDNAALNNSTFDVKRNEIIKMDKKGDFIPFCTKMVFLKYYTPSENNQVHFWGQADRVAYIENINTVLKDYLTDKILVQKEMEEA